MKTKNLTAHYALIMALYWSNLAVLSNYASVYLLGHGFHNTQIGMMIAAASLLSALIQPLLGTYADRPESPSVRSILLMLIFAFLAFGVLIPITAGRSQVLLTICYALALTMMLSMVPFVNSIGTLSAKEGRTVNFAAARGIGSLVYAGTSYLIGRGVANFGISLIPLVSIAIYAGFALSLAAYPFQKTALPGKNRAHGSFLKKYPRFLIVLAASTCLYTSHVLINSFAFQIIGTKGGNSEELGVVFAVAALSEIPMMLFFTRFLRKMSAGKWLALSGFAFLLKCVCTLLVKSIPAYYGIQLLQFFGYAVISVASVYYIDGIMAPEDAVKGQAFFTMTNTAGSVLASALGGWILDASGVTALLVLATVFSGIGAAVMPAGMERNRN